MPNGISARYQGKAHDGACVERVYFLICQIRWYRRSIGAFVLVEILGQELFLCARRDSGNILLHGAAKKILGEE